MIKMIKKWKASLISWMAVVLLLCSIAPVALAQETVAGDTITVCVTMEKFTLGQGYKIQPTLMRVPTGTKASALIAQMLGEGNYEITGTVDSGFYLSAIADNDLNINIPDYIMTAINDHGGLDSRGDNHWLGEFDYYTNSGWMYCVNDRFPGVGAADYTLKNGDVMRWQYTLYGLGADLNADNREWGTSALITTANKDKLTWRMGEINAKADVAAWLAQGDHQRQYDNAMAMLKNMESSQDQVDTALAALQEAADPTGDTNGDGMINVTDLGIVQNYFNRSVTPGEEGDVNGDGKVNVTDLTIVQNHFNESI